MKRFPLRCSFILLCYILLQRNNKVEAYITRTATHCSSVLSTINDHALLANAFSVQTTADFFACAQSCLGDSRCMSVNFHSVSNNGLCEMNTDYVDGVLEQCTRLYYRKDSVFGQLVNVSDPVFQPEIEKPERKEYFFTTLGASGRIGPTNTTKYDGTLLEGKVTLSDGIQLWTVPQTGDYVIESFGASGANGTCLGETNCTGKEWRLGGLGAVMKGTFNLSKGTRLKILVGQEGSRTENFGTRPGGGGGGTFVVRYDNTPLIIAGGGGGGAQPKSSVCLDGGPGLVGEDGGVCGGSGGNGGLQCDEMGRPGASLAGGTGAGFNTDGLGFQAFRPGSYSFINGGKGGVGPADVQGAFGGGAFGLQQPGGGGGYSGGGLMGTSDTGQAGGGGSYNNGTNPSNKEGANKGDGKVIITYQ
ncbi:uncharacterized protein LOC116288114 [Actinia tenebrosa]|uniref:receptor protein-tyrosine kinase n=1 Tax=Actinia tenebrosa TaxID=6105 RepID=A0A6P8HDS3_ACTTE|nr:uncharacterized protein LOC116288114 [Actinia tenebrosa]